MKDIIINSNESLIILDNGLYKSGICNLGNTSSGNKMLKIHPTLTNHSISFQILDSSRNVLLSPSVSQWNIVVKWPAWNIILFQIKSPTFYTSRNHSTSFSFQRNCATYGNISIGIEKARIFILYISHR